MPESEKRSSEKRSSKKRSSKKRSSEKRSNNDIKLTIEVIKRFEPNSDFSKRVDSIDSIRRKPPLEEYPLHPGGGRKRKTSKRKHRKTKR